jgi:uncharacterized OsmC-like protein
MSSQASRTAEVVGVPEAEHVNGINVPALHQTVEAVKGNPAIAKFRFKVKNEWIDGAYNRSTINEFHGAMQDMERKQSFLLHADEPAVLLGRDQGPNAGEYLLQALAACVTSSLIFHAAARGIVIEEVESTVEGDADLRGFLDTDQSVRKGFQSIRMSFDIGANVSDEEFEQIAQLGPTFSPVFDTLSKGVAIGFQARRMKKV